MDVIGRIDIVDAHFRCQNNNVVLDCVNISSGRI